MGDHELVVAWIETLVRQYGIINCEGLLERLLRIENLIIIECISVCPRVEHVEHQLVSVCVFKYDCRGNLVIDKLDWHHVVKHIHTVLIVVIYFNLVQVERHLEKKVTSLILLGKAADVPPQVFVGLNNIQFFVDVVKDQRSIHIAIFQVFTLVKFGLDEDIECLYFSGVIALLDLLLDKLDIVAFYKVN